MRTVLSTCLLVIFAFLTPIDALASNYYVRASGDDSNTGLAPSIAFATIKKAAEVAVSGDTVYVGAGTYTDAITIDGVQQSTSLTRFIADTFGTYTGDAGNVVVTGTLGVVNSNYVEFHTFQFQSNTSWFVVWKGSYEGLFKDCVFTAGSEPLLIKDGEVTLEDCQLTDFLKDGIYVDGEALVLLLNSTISGCQQEGIEISKTARVVLDGTTIEDNVGDGIKVESNATTVDDGGIGAPPATGRSRLAAGKFRIIASAGMFDGYDSDQGPYGPANSGEDADLYGNTIISTSPTVPVTGNVYYAPGGTASAPNITGTISQLSSPITMDPVDPGDAATNNNNASIPLTDLGMNAYSAGNLIVPFGHTLDLPPGTYYFLNMFVNGGTLRLSGPTTVFVVGQVSVGGGTVVNPSLKPSDFKLSVMGPAVTLTGTAAFHGAIYAPNARITLSGTVQVYGMAVANEIVMSGGGIHVDTSLTDYAATVQGIVSGSSSPAPPVGWSAIASGQLVVSSSTFNNNRRGVHMETGQELDVRVTQFSNHSEWAIYSQGPLALDTVTANDNGTGGLWMKGHTDSDFLFTDLTLTDNGSHGIYLEDCDVTFSGTSLDPSLITGSDHVLASSGGKLTIDGLTISGGAVAGVLATSGELTAQNATFSGNGYGVAVDGTSLAVVDNCTITNNSVGLYLHENQDVDVLNSTLQNNSTWAASVYASAAVGANVTFDTCDVHDNADGIAVLNAASGDFTLLDTNVHDNTQAGVHFEDCNLTLSNQAANNWQVTGNQYNIRSLRSTLTLSGVTVDDSSSYGIFCEDSDVSLAGCTVRGRYGIYADAANDALTITASRFDANTLSGWGVVRYGGDVTIKNSVFHGYWGAIYLDTPVGAVQATILNSTLGNVQAYGVYVAQGDATVQNSILTGDGAGYGLIETGSAILVHSYNMLDNFSTPLSGTPADSTEVLKSPRFVDAANGDYHLGVGSPAINVGFDLGAQVPTDMDGNARPSFNAYELGAYEYVNPNGSLRVLKWNESR